LVAHSVGIARPGRLPKKEKRCVEVAVA